MADRKYGIEGRRYLILDVFADTVLQGKPPAVVLDGAAVDARWMQAVVGEFNLSETVFVQPPEDLAHTDAIRILTPHSEMLLAGNPTIGTSFALPTDRGLADGATIILEEGAVQSPIPNASAIAATASAQIERSRSG